MKSRNTLLRLRRFQYDEKRRRLAQIEMMMNDFGRMASDLEREILAEEQKSGITDRNHFAYPTFARAACQRRENLLASIEDLRDQLALARVEMEEAKEELHKAELLEGRERPLDSPLSVMAKKAEGMAIPAVS
ncbi:MAG: flagellar export protein FliJ [Methylobacteriaceae bacterium]|jgi:flagellar export protein FliJ|nr:flagellar export protein FliJ [Methylobacteriaceae bacterium]